MTYRKLIVNGKQFQYVVGKTHTKIKGLGAFMNQEVGEFVVKQEKCGCCGEPLSVLFSSHVDPIVVSVQPRHVSRFIQKMTA